MPNTKNSPEYKILSFMNEGSTRNNSNISENDILIGSRIGDIHAFRTTFKTMLEVNKHIEQRSESDGGGYKITASGEARFGDMQQHIDSLQNAIALKINTEKIRQNTKEQEATNRLLFKIKLYGFLISLTGLFFLGLQTFFMWQQNSIESRQLDIDQIKMMQSSGKIESAPVGHDHPSIQINVNGNKVNCDSAHKNP